MKELTEIFQELDVEITEQENMEIEFTRKLAEHMEENRVKLKLIGMTDKEYDKIVVNGELPTTLRLIEILSNTGKTLEMIDNAYSGVTTGRLKCKHSNN